MLKYIAIAFLINLCAALFILPARAAAPAAGTAPKQTQTQPQAQPQAQKQAQPQAQAHPLDGVWTASVTESAKNFEIPPNLKRDLADMRMTLLVKTGSMALAWSDGTSVKKKISIISTTGKLYKMKIGDKPCTMDATTPNRLILTEKDAYFKDNSIIFQRAK
ncbi:MAG: hypothetical protein LBV76_04420 [Deltaproteobacteria bacterium]|jgi:glucose/arabinose dehydrogenase|nr:hypothetical protein [Deltaproteobacteria bacterium]